MSVTGEAAPPSDDAPRRRLRAVDRDSVAVRLRERIDVTFVSLAAVVGLKLLAGH